MKPLLSFRAFLRDKSYFLIAVTVLGLAMFPFLVAYKVNVEAIIALGVIWVIFVTAVLLIEYYRKRNFYRNLYNNTTQLDQAYLVLETLERPNFYDGKILFEILCDINKSMIENVKKYKIRSQELQEYVEMWIHEVKTPLATLAVISDNPQISEQVKRIDDYVEQILYLARAENAEKDYLIAPVQLSDLVGKVASRNRELLQAKHIDLIAKDLDYTVRSDAKWLEFVLNQIINNSIKYQSSQIEISAREHDRKVILSIRDNGIGIAEKDLPRIFEKSFTGSNGRRAAQSTGMGLYIAKTLCERLGHQISAQSETGKYTQVDITFSLNDYYQINED